MKKIILFLIVSFSFLPLSNALTYGGCDYSAVSRMKSIVTNINLSYDYKIIDNEAYFDVKLNNLTEDIYFYDTATEKKYYYSDTIDGEIAIINYKINSGSYKFYSNLNECPGVFLGTKYYKFPDYNKYYADPLCDDIPNYSLCQKWGYVNYSREEFEQKVFEYKDSKPINSEKEITVEYQKTFIDVIIGIYIKYYYYFLGGIILICGVVIIVNNKKNRFDL